MVKVVEHPSWIGKPSYVLRKPATLALLFVIALTGGFIVTYYQFTKPQNLQQQAAYENTARIENINFVGGMYEFTVEAKNVLFVTLDKTTIYDNFNGRESIPKSFTAGITPGIHTVKILYSTSNTDPNLQVTWRKL